MKAVVLTAAANLNPTRVARLTSDLGLSLPKDELIVVSSHPSRQPVPATTHIWLRGGSLAGVRRPVLPIEAPVVPDDTEDDNETAPSHAQIVATLPPHHPKRIAHGLKWRSRKLRRQLKAKRGSGRKSRLPIAAVRSDASSITFTQACLRSSLVRRAVEEADVVLAHDLVTHRAGWMLARAYAGPAVVIDVTAARRALDLRRSAD